MKTIAAVIATFMLLRPAFAGERVDAATWRNVPTYDVSTLLQREVSLLGRIVAVKFNCRSEKLRHLHPNWYQAAIWQHDPKAKNGFSALRVMIAKKDVPAFKTITSDFNATTDTTVYARIEKDPEANLVYLRLLGRKVALDSAGNATVDW